MFHKCIQGFKNLVKNFKCEFGDLISTFLIQCYLLSLVFIVAIAILEGFKITFTGVIELIFFIPLISGYVAIVRLALKCVHILLPFEGIIRLILNIITFFIVTVVLGYYAPTPDSEIHSTIFVIVYDLLYFGVIFYFKKSK